MRFFRHDGICRPMNNSINHLSRSTAPRPGSTQASNKDAPEVLRPTHRRDEYRPAIPQRVARQHCPPPLHRHAHPKTVPGSATMNFQRTVNSVLTVCLSPGDHPNPFRCNGLFAAVENPDKEVLRIIESRSRAVYKIETNTTGSVGHFLFALL
jgi:hypothetical protein